MKRRYKITPVSTYDIRGLESWLEDMALRGLTLKRFRPLFSSFEEGPARKTRYRAEPYRKNLDDAPPQDMLELYREFGWELACEAPDTLIFFTQDPDAPEPHTDPQLQGTLWKKLLRSKRRGFVISLILIPIVAVCALWSLFQYSTPIANLLTTSVLWMFALLALLLVDIPINWAAIQRLALIVRQLEAGVPLDHRIVYPRRRWSTMVFTALVFLLLFLLVVSQYVLPFTGGSAQSLEELTDFTPLSLAEMEHKGYVPYHFEMNGTDYSNFYAVDHYLLCPNRWQVVQTGSAGSEEQTRLAIWRYDLPDWLSGLSRPLVRELLDRETGVSQFTWWIEHSGPAWTVEYFPGGDIQFLAVARHPVHNSQIAAAAAGDKVVLIRYTDGQQDLAEHLDEIIGMVR